MAGIEGAGAESSEISQGNFRTAGCGEQVQEDRGVYRRGILARPPLEKTEGEDPDQCEVLDRKDREEHQARSLGEQNAAQAGLDGHPHLGNGPTETKSGKNFKEDQKFAS